MSMNPSEVPVKNTPCTIAVVIIGFMTSLSAALVCRLPGLGGYGSVGFIGALFCLANVRYVRGWLRPLAILGVIFGLGAFVAAYVRCVVITGDPGRCGD